MIFGKRSRLLNARSQKKLSPDDKSLMFSYHTQSQKNIPDNISPYQPIREPVKIDHNQQQGEKESRPIGGKRNKSEDMRMKLPPIEFAENSVELEGESVSIDKKIARFDHQGQSSKERPQGLLFKGFEITNISKEMAFNDSPFTQHLEGKSPRVKKRLNHFKFAQYALLMLGSMIRLHLSQSSITLL